MSRIEFPLGPQTRGAKIVPLHEALAALGYDVAPAEADTQRFGETTRAAVTAFQDRHGLERTGTVDEATAKLINRLMNERTPPAPPSDPGAAERREAAVDAATGRAAWRGLLGVAASEREVPLVTAARAIAGETGAATATPHIFLREVLRARGHHVLADVAPDATRR